jgi:hypothetical protein
MAASVTAVASSVKTTTTVTSNVEANRIAYPDTRGLSSRGSTHSFSGRLECQY